MRTCASIRFPDLEIVSDPGSLGEHDGGRAVFFRREMDRARDLLRLEPFAGHDEVEVDLGEDLGSSDARSASMSTMHR
jgi:hypothetical protein